MAQRFPGVYGVPGRIAGYPVAIHGRRFRRGEILCVMDGRKTFAARPARLAAWTVAALEDHYHSGGFWLVVRVLFWSANICALGWLFMSQRKWRYLKENGPKVLAVAGALAFLAAFAWHAVLYSRIQSSPFAYEYGSVAWPTPTGLKIAAMAAMALLIGAFVWTLYRRFS